ncbi:hypothetical protein HW932_00690 [Allochromatium humboldtianum]|uniref:Uncharacterized protein n=1 Tax=Allochromatium humboldtianum TaxID=504901 RepID=A0A850R2F1_9GAMM|nr:hypothetical protein [Allochromatium humboldtianum]NVZ07774.1 hypothetical protein [Allochromatium humboldtianum]
MASPKIATLTDFSEPTSHGDYISSRSPSNSYRPHAEAAKLQSTNDEVQTVDTAACETRLALTDISESKALEKP